MTPPWATVKEYLWTWRVVLVTTPSVTLLILLLRALGLLQPSEWFMYDQFMRLRPDLAQDDRIAIVGVDEGDYRLLQQAQIADGVLADVITKLRDQNPRAIGLDFYRNLPMEPGHDRLVEVFQTTPNLVGIRKVVGEIDRETVGSSEYLEQIGSNDVIEDGDKRVRRGLIALKHEEDGWIASFSILLADLYLTPEGQGAEFMPLDEDTPLSEGWNLKFGDTVLPEFQPNDGSYIRADAGGKQILINYHRGHRAFEVVSLRQVLQDQLPPDWATDRIILIGPFSEADKDTFFVPHSSGFVGEATPMYGIEIHAHLISQILRSTLDEQPFIQSWPEGIEWLWTLLWAGAGATTAWLLRKGEADPKQIVKQITANGLLVGTLLGGTFWLFTRSWWVPVVPPFLALLGSSITIIGYVAQSANSIRKTFGRYLSDDIVETLLESPDGLKLGGEHRVITILTSDLRGFTATSERLPPKEVVRLLNFYLGHMADVITEYGGTIDEFMGDGILVLFGAPTQRGNDAERAIACAIAMQRAMETVNQQMEEWGYEDLEMGIGINTGEVVVGNIGSVKRTKYGVVGSPINLTYRIESYTTGGQVLISESTYTSAQQTGAAVTVRSTKEVQAKGIKHPITIYEVGAIGGTYTLTLPQEAQQFQELAQPVAIEYALLSGKNIDNHLYQGEIISLSRKQARIRLSQQPGDPIPPLEPLLNLKLNLKVSAEAAPGIATEDVYAKVLEEPQASDGFYIYFTAKPPIIAKYLNQLYRSP
ncbi:MAG: CHASE2 domain-containing protein [Prochlorothrix sp.]